MTATVEQARDEIQARFLADWQALSTTIPGISAVPEVRWQGLDDNAGPPTTDAPWARVTLTHGAGLRHTFGRIGERRMERVGVLTVQVFYPIKKSGMSRLLKLATIVRNAFENRTTPSGVWFRNVAIREQTPYQGWNQVNVTADFVYDELR